MSTYLPTTMHTSLPLLIRSFRFLTLPWLYLYHVLAAAASNSHPSVVVLISRVTGIHTRLNAPSPLLGCTDIAIGTQL